MKPSRNLIVLLTIAAVTIGLAILILRMDPDHGHEEEYGHHAHDSDHGDHEDQDGHEDAHGHEDEHDEDHEETLVVRESALFRSGTVLDTIRTVAMASRIPLQGKIVLNEDRAAHIHPRFPGVIVQVKKQLGERVEKGEVLAVIESNESLRPYELTARTGGVVLRRHASIGESVSEGNELFVIADLSVVWADFQVYRRDFYRLKPGQKVRVLAEGLPPVETRLAYLSPSAEPHTQSLLARAELRNDDGIWTPGLFIRGEAAVEEFTATAVRLEAIQNLPEGPAVFVRKAEGRYEVRPVTVGRRDGDWIEILSGAAPGEVYVTRGSFLLKAERGKGEASHDH